MQELLRVLVVDSNCSDLDDTCSKLEVGFNDKIVIKRLKKSLFVAQNIATFQPELVVISMFLNGVNALDVIRVVRDNYIMTPFIVLARGDLEFMPLARKIVPENNITAILKKPCDVTELKTSISNTLKQHSDIIYCCGD